MPEQYEKTVVNSWNEWDPLKHIILGLANGNMVQAPEPAVQHDWSEHGFPLGKYGPLPKQMEEKANEQLDNFAEILEDEGIRVDRPTPLDFSQRVQTSDWVQETMFGCMPARDLLLDSKNAIVRPQFISPTHEAARPPLQVALPGLSTTPLRWPRPYIVVRRSRESVLLLQSRSGRRRS